LTLALIPDSTGQPKVVFRGGPSAWSQTEEGYEDFCASLERLVAVCENANYRMVAADVEACEQLHRVMTVASVLYRPSVFRIKGRSRVMFDLTVGYGKREDIISWKLPEDFRVVTRSGWFSDTVLVDQGEFLAAIMELRDVAATAEPVEVAYESYRA
jgi:hypothetical protein